MFLRRPFCVRLAMIWPTVQRYYPSTPSRCCSVKATEETADWTCACGFLNYGFRRTCFCCHQTNGAQSKTAVALQAKTIGESMLDATFKKGDWQCVCGVHNFARRDECVRCGRSKPQYRNGMGAIGHQKFLPGDWICSRCKSHNFRSRKLCMKCSDPPPPTSSTSPAEGKVKGTAALPSWVCESCHSVNPGDSSASCAICGSVKPVSTSDVSPSPSRAESHLTSPRSRQGDWACPMCGFENFASRLKCKACQHDCPADHRSGTPPQSGMWGCSCGYQNYENRTTCRDCGAPHVP